MAEKASSNRIDPHTAAALVRRLLTEYGLTRWKRYVFAFALMGLGAACTALTAYMIRDIVNEAYVQKNFPGVVQIAVLTFFLFVIRGLTHYGHSVILLRIGNSIVADNQRRMFSGLLQQNIGFFADHHSSEFAARLTAGAQAATQVLNLLITALGRDLLTLIALLIVMITQDPIMSLVAFVIAPPLGIVMRKLTRRVRTVAHNQWVGGARILETLQETLQGMRIVKAFTLEDAVRARFQSHVADVERESNKMARVSQRVHPFTEGLGGLAAMLIMVYAGYSTIYGGATPGQFVSFMSSLLLAYEPAKRLARLNLDLNATLVGVRVLFEIIDRPLTEPEDDTRPSLTLNKARVEFSHVSFAYREGEPVLRDISFVAEPGKVTALVGPSGGGKSTILNLIIRFYEAQGGTITIDGQDIAAVSRRSLRQQIALVGQDTFLFRASVRDNIAFGKPDAREAEIIAAAKAAHAHDFIMGFHAGYDTEVGEHGCQAVRRRAPARRHRARADQERAHHPARRGDRGARFGVRAPCPAGDLGAVQGPHHDRDRAPALDHHACRPHPGDRGRRRRGIGTARRALARERPLRRVLQPAAPQREAPSAAAARIAGRRRHLDTLNIL